MKQKITISAIFRRSIVIICAVFCFVMLFACFDDSYSVPTLSDIFAPDVSVAYDGSPHSISIANTLPTDTVTYSRDGTIYSQSCPAFTDVGNYTVYFKVIRSGYAEYFSSATVSISPIILSDISASDVTFVYDGLSHSILVDGVLATDNITYSTDGVTFSSAAPSLINVGEYTVYYRVERPYGEYKSSCTVTILPNIYGRYFNPDHGVMVISENISFSVSGAGHINSIPFSVSDGVLTYNSNEYCILSDSEYVYRLTVADKSVYFISAASGSLSVSFDDNTALVTLDKDVLLSLPNFNYCESGTVVDYAELTFTQAFSSNTNITDISIELSFRAVNPITVDTLYFTYDGQPHGFDFSDDVILLKDGSTSFTDVGSYSVSVIYTSTVYLPKRLDCMLVILPEIDGVFVSSEHVIRLSNGNVYFDGKPCGELSANESTWTFNGIPITVTAGGIVYDNTTYTSVDCPILAVYMDNLYCSYILVSSDIFNLHISYNGSVLTFRDDNDTLLLSITLSCDSISVSLDGDPLTPLGDSQYFNLGYSDFPSTIGVVEIVTE